MEEYTKNLQTTLTELLGDLECAVCLELLNEPVMTSCCHQFCRKCITQVLQNNRSATCPLCKTSITKRSITKNQKLLNIVQSAIKTVKAIQEESGITINVSSFREHLTDLERTCINRTTEIPEKKNEKEKNKKNTRQSKKITPILICEDKANDTEVDTAVNRNVTNINISSGFPSPKKTDVKHRLVRKNWNLRNSRTSLTYKANIENLSQTHNQADVVKNAARTCTSFDMHSKPVKVVNKVSLENQLLDYISFGSLQAQKDIQQSTDAPLIPDSPSNTSLCSITQQLMNNNRSISETSSLVPSLLSGTESILPVEEKIGHWLATATSIPAQNTDIFSCEDNRSVFEITRKTSPENICIDSKTSELSPVYEAECHKLQNKNDMHKSLKDSGLMDSVTEIFPKSTMNRSTKKKRKKRMTLNKTISDENKSLINLRNNTEHRLSDKECLQRFTTKTDQHAYLSSQSSDSIVQLNDEAEFKDNHDLSSKSKLKSECKILQRNFWSSDDTVRNSASESDDDIGLNMLFVTPQGWNMSHVNKTASTKQYTRKRSNDKTTKGSKEISDGFNESLEIHCKSKETNFKIKNRKRRAKKNSKENKEELEHLKSKIDDAEAHELYISQTKNVFQPTTLNVIEINDNSEIDTKDARINENADIASKKENTNILEKKNNNDKSENKSRTKGKLIIDSIMPSEEKSKNETDFNKTLKNELLHSRPIRKCRWNSMNKNLTSDHNLVKPSEKITSPGWSHQKQMANDFQNKIKQPSEDVNIEYAPTVISAQPYCPSPVSDEYAVSPFSSTSEEKFPQRKIPDADKNIKEDDSIKSGNKNTNKNQTFQIQGTGFPQNEADSNCSRKESLRSCNKEKLEKNNSILENQQLTFKKLNCENNCHSKITNNQDNTVTNDSEKAPVGQTLHLTNSATHEEENTVFCKQSESNHSGADLFVKQSVPGLKEIDNGRRSIEEQSPAPECVLLHDFNKSSDVIIEDSCKGIDENKCPKNNFNDLLNFTKNEIKENLNTKTKQISINESRTDKSLNDCPDGVLSVVNTLHNEIACTESNDTIDYRTSSKSYSTLTKDINSKNIKEITFHENYSSQRKDKILDDSESCLQLHSVKRPIRKTFTLDADTEDLNFLIKSSKSEDNLIEFSEGILQGSSCEVEDSKLPNLNKTLDDFPDSSCMNVNVSTIKKSPHRQSKKSSFQSQDHEIYFESVVNHSKTCNPTEVNESDGCNSEEKNNSQKRQKFSTNITTIKEISADKVINKSSALVEFSENQTQEFESVNDKKSNSIKIDKLNSITELAAVNDMKQADLKMTTKCPVKFYFCSTLIPKNLNIRSIGVQVEIPSQIQPVSNYCSRAIQTSLNESEQCLKNNLSVIPVQKAFPKIKPGITDFSGSDSVLETKIEDALNSSINAKFCLKCNCDSSCICEYDKQSFVCFNKTDGKNEVDLQIVEDCETANERVDSLNCLEKKGITAIDFQKKDGKETQSNRFSELTEHKISGRISQISSSENERMVPPSNETGDYCINIRSHLKHLSPKRFVNKDENPSLDSIKCNGNTSKTHSDSDSSFTGQSVSLLLPVDRAEREEENNTQDLNSEKDLEQQNIHKSNEKRKCHDLLSECNPVLSDSDDTPNKSKRRRTVRGLTSKLFNSVITTLSNVETSHSPKQLRNSDDDSEAADSCHDLSMVDMELVPPTPPRNCVGNLSKSTVISPVELHRSKIAGGIKRELNGTEKPEEKFSSVIKDDTEYNFENSKNILQNDTDIKIIPESLTQSSNISSTKKKFKRIKSWSEDSSDEGFVARKKLNSSKLENNTPDELNEFIPDTENVFASPNVNEKLCQLPRKSLSAIKTVSSFNQNLSSPQSSNDVSYQKNISNTVVLTNSESANSSPTNGLSKVLANVEADILLYKQFNDGKFPKTGMNEESSINDDESVVILERSGSILNEEVNVTKKNKRETDSVNISNAYRTEIKFNGMSNNISQNHTSINGRRRAEDKENDSSVTVSQLTLEENIKDDKTIDVYNQSISSLLNEMSCTLTTQTEIGDTQQQEELRKDIERIQEDMKLLQEKLKTISKPTTAINKNLEEAFKQCDDKEYNNNSCIYPFEVSGLDDVDDCQSRNCDKETVFTEDQENPICGNKTGLCSDSKDDKEEKKVLKSETLCKRTNTVQEKLIPNDPWDEDRRKRGKLSFVVTGVAKSKMVLIKELVNHLKADLQSGFSLQTTHVIVNADKDLKCERTFKYFQGIAGKKWVVGFQWVSASLKANHLLPEEDFEVTSDTAIGTHNGPRLSRLSELSLFSDYEICCLGPFPQMSREQFVDLIEMCGATTVFDPSMYHYQPRKRQIILADADNNLSNNFNEYFRKYRAITLSWHWALDSISCFQCLPFKQYLLCNPKKARLL